MRIWLMMIAMVVLLVGCCPTPVVRVVDKVEYKTFTTPTSLLKKCVVSVPPERTGYAKATAKDKEDMLASYSVKLLSDLDVCNKQIKEIEDYLAKQIKLVKE